MIKQFLSILVGLLLFTTRAFGMEPCYICNDKDPEICLEARFPLVNCGHSYHLTCIHQWTLTNPTCPQCKTLIAPMELRYLKYRFGELNPTSTTADPATAPGRQGQQPADSSDILSRTSASKRRTLFLVCGCAGIAAMVLYYFKDTVGELCWCKKDTEPVDTEPQETV